MLLQNRGVIAYVTFIVLLGIIILAVAIGHISLSSNSSSKNYNYKLQTFNAADGAMTLLAQDILDFNEGSYLTTELDNKDIGNVVTAGYYKRSNGIDTVKGDGSTFGGNSQTSDNFHYAYSPVSGDFQVTVKINSLQYTSDYGKAALHVRESDAANSAFFHAAITYQNGLYIQYRKTTGAGASQVNLSGSTPIWVRITRSGDTFTAEKTSNGSTWTTAGTQTIAMKTSVLAGLGVASYSSGTLNTAVFSNLSGLGANTATGSMLVGDNEIPVDYTITQTGPNTFKLTTNAYFLNTKNDKKMFGTRLMQELSREAIGQWHSTQRDSALIPVTLYDFRADQSHPEFNIRGTIGLSYMSNIPAHFVQDTLDEERKPVLKQDNSFRSCFISAFNSSWYAISAAARVAASNADSAQKVACYYSNGSKFTWDFCDSLHTWFRPWGDSTGKSGTYEFDTLTGRWSGLVKRRLSNGSLAPDSSWVTAHWDSSNPYANIVFYDTLVFRELPAPDTGTFRFGDSAHAWGADEQFFVRSCNYSDGTNDFKYSEWRFMPLKGRGFGYDATRYIKPGSNACCDQQNFSFTMEIHRKFTYKPGQIFKFRGDDDVWLFINNKKVIDLGGVHLPCSATVDLDTCGLLYGQEYNFDFFYCERNVESSNILITTNLMFYTPPQPLKRSWMRDYGNLD